MSENGSDEISQAVLHTLLYSDIFEYPLTVLEVQRFLHGISATYEEVLQALNENSNIVKVDSYFLLKGREEIVSIRKRREVRSQQLLPYALKFGRIIGSLPFVRMVVLTGSLAVLNVSQNVDFDYMLVTIPGRLWTARAFALLLNRLTRLFGHTICPNLIVDQNSLEWHQHDLYSARELCQMIPIAGMKLYQELKAKNKWVKEFLPNASMESGSLPPMQERTPALQTFLESLLNGKFGDRFERWEMNRKIARFSKQDGFGEETVFNADICQGNFDHHHKRTQEELQRRLRNLKLEHVRVNVT